MVRRVVTAPIPATGAGVTGVRTAIATPDDAQIRHVVGVKASVTTKGITLNFDVNGAPQVTVDAAVLGQLTHALQVAYDVGQNVQISFNVINTTGGALNAGDFVTVIYEVPQ